MLLRVVRVTIAPGREADYWAWSRDILRLWDEHGVRRAGGPYAGRGAGGEHTATWLTVHESEEQAREEFRSMYSGGRGQELIALRPPLVANTTSDHYPDWDGTGAAPGISL